MQKIKGRLRYVGWNNTPWTLTAENGETIDLWPFVHEFFTSFAGRHAEQRLATDAYVLTASEESKFVFNYDPGSRVILEKDDGWSNVHAYFDDTLVWLSGRLVEVEIADAQLRVAADKSEEVFCVSLDDSNVGEIPNGAEQTICKIGCGAECCIFLTANADGFRCQKFSGPMALIMLGRLAEKDIRAQRIGNCAWLGRK